ncbi:alpha/beta fold hydrolase [Lysinibacillus sp. SGAir0095]|uniref:alpha/beta fold hydrolase n=1 Tax=Lysinibacillus sp. SGAir0095 TaxID=2070463 RepID=UPI0010CD3676|nr:alpha/beta fold hydrolase [Lysinibacillus sp. SGAir0095]QCR32687.1 alpha/beta hydrolase [Lysinibacillus sp. SGAir0095]
MLHYTRKGTGEKLVLVHGFLGDAEIFSPILEELTKSYDVVAVDLPGHGQSKVERESYSVYDYAREVSEVLRHENITNATWLGHSLGGYIVLAALEKKIAPISNAILAYTTDGSDTEEQKEKRTNQQLEIPEIGVEKFVDQLIEAFFSDQANKETINFARKIAYRASEEGLILALESMKNRPNQQNLIENISIPILVVEGSQDKIVKPIKTMNSNIQRLETNTAHLGMLEDPNSFLKGIQEFMSEN